MTDRTSTANSVGTKGEARSAQKDRPTEAIERLEARPWTSACTDLLRVIATDANFADWTTNPTLPEFLLSAATHLHQLEEENAGLREDAERLNWLDGVNVAINERNSTTYGWRYDINHNRAALTDHNIPPLTVRDAIDVARGVKSATEAALSSQAARSALTRNRGDA